MTQYHGFPIFRTQDELGEIVVTENRSTRKLYFDSPVEQSCFYLNAPMTLNFEYQQKIVDRVLDFCDRAALRTPRILMLGLGGGSIAHHLYHVLPEMQMTVVELRQAVIDCAYRFFQLPDEPEIETLQADALRFCAENTHPFDLVIVDLFDAHGIPDAFSQTEFQDNLLKQLKPHGQLICNLWNQTRTSESDPRTPTPESGRILNHWQKTASQNKALKLNRYNIDSSDNLILTIERD